MHYSHGFGEPAHAADVGLNYIDVAPVDQIRKFEPGSEPLARGNRDTGGCVREARVAFQIVRRQGVSRKNRSSGRPADTDSAFRHHCHLRQASPAAVKLDRSKVYIAFTRSDGDGLNFLRNNYRKLFDDPQHGSVPIGWQVGSTAADTMPDILAYYYKHARPVTAS